MTTPDLDLDWVRFDQCVYPGCEYEPTWAGTYAAISGCDCPGRRPYCTAHAELTGEHLAHSCEPACGCNPDSHLIFRRMDRLR